MTCPNCNCDKWLTPAEVMAVMGWSRSTLYQRTKIAEEAQNWEMGMFPKPMRDGPKVIRYSSYKLRQYQIAFEEMAA